MIYDITRLYSYIHKPCKTALYVCFGCRNILSYCYTPMHKLALHPSVHLFQFREHGPYNGHTSTLGGRPASQSHYTSAGTRVSTRHDPVHAVHEDGRRQSLMYTTLDISSEAVADLKRGPSRLRPPFGHCQILHLCLFPCRYRPTSISLIRSRDSSHHFVICTSGYVIYSTKF